GAVNGVSTIDFDSLALFTHYNNGSPLQAAPLATFYPNQSGDLIVQSNIWGSACQGECLLAPYNSGGTALNTLAGVLALGFNVITSADTPQPVNVKVYLAGNATATPDFVSSPVATNANTTGPVFFGITSDQVIAKLEITSANDYVLIDNYSIATALNGGSGG